MSQKPGALVSTIKTMRKILSFEASLALVRDLSEGELRYDPGRRYAKPAGVWPPAPLRRDSLTWEEREKADRFFLKQSTPPSAWERAGL